MRIQHNIMAMNSYRNLSGNNNALSKNLEKLSSGYRINRAGDDAAGLAISEKMRAQISGLDQAQKNAQSGINLVKTAEGALTEVHDMLNRMVTLATQSANGTYEGSDREKLQAEVDALIEEIDRIADNSNFNGTKLLNGELSGAAVTTEKGVAGSAAVTAVKGTYTAAPTGAVTATNASGNYEVTIGGKTYDIGNTATTVGDQAAAWITAFKADSTADDVFDITYATADGTVTFTQKTAGTGTNKDIGITVSAGTAGVAAKAEETGTATTTEIDFTGMTGEKVIGGTIKIGTVTYEFIDADDASATAATGNTAVKVAKSADAAAIAAAVNTELSKDTSGVLAKFSNRASDAKITLTEDKPIGSSRHDSTVEAGVTVEQRNMGNLSLQIGADSVETISVSVDSMKAQSLGLEDLKITDVALANEAIDTIKAAIEKVSVTRGDLGAIQNRLEHTINNLGVMEENIQDAEANIRDTDIADEMMAYTKNNILIQSAQAMLAQANQVPQGVLQLMQ